MNEYIVAIELGSTKVVGIAGYRDANNNLVVSAIDVNPVTSNVIKRGYIHNVNEAFACINQLKRKLENRLAPAKIVKTYVGISGISVASDDRTAQRTFAENSIITQAHVEKLKEECRSAMPKTVDTLDLVSAGYIIDGRPERIATGVTGTTIEARYKAITAKPELRRNIERCIVERMKLPIVDYIVSALATAQVVLSKDERMLGCMLVDFGAETTTVSIYKNDMLLSLTTLPMGGRNITRDIMSLKLKSSEAEDLKKNSGLAMGYKSEMNKKLKYEGDNMVAIDLAKLTSVVEARSEEIVANVEEQLTRAGLTSKDLPAGLVVVGGAAKMRGWIELLEDYFIGIKVREGALREDIKVVEKFTTEINEYIQAVGLLNAATEPCTLTLNAGDEDRQEEDVVVNVGRNTIPADDDEEEADEVVEVPKKNKFFGWGIFNVIRNKFGQIIEEGENDNNDKE